MDTMIQELKKSFFAKIEDVKAWEVFNSPNKGNENKDELQKVEMQDRAIQITAARPKRPSVPKGTPPKTS